MGNYVVHSWSSERGDGYGGSSVSFLTENGYKTVKGPYCMSFGDRDYQRLVDLLDLPELYNIVSAISVGTMKRESNGQWGQLSDIVYEDREVVLGPVLPRIKSDWHGLHVEVKMNSSMRSLSVANLLENGEDWFH